jgi:hypothetical protein
MFSPNDNQMIQMLLRRGVLDADQLLFARVEQAIERSPSLLEVLVKRGDVLTDDIRAVLDEVRSPRPVGLPAPRQPGPRALPPKAQPARHPRRVWA